MGEQKLFIEIAFSWMKNKTKICEVLNFKLSKKKNSNKIEEKKQFSTAESLSKKWKHLNRFNFLGNEGL